MKIVVIGGSGLIGSRLVNKLHEQGHETVAASPSSGVNTLTAELTAFAAAVNDGKPFPVSHAEILHGVEVFEAIVNSAASGEIVRIG